MPRTYKKTLVYSSVIVLFLALISWSRTLADVNPLTLEKSAFRENEQSTIVLHPSLNDGSTNIAFYIPYNSPTNWVWQAETPSVGDATFSNYWAPTPAIGKYIVIEYRNDKQQFSCSGLSLNDCLNDPHFISKEAFDIIDNSGTDVAATTATDQAAGNISTTTVTNISELLSAVSSSSPIISPTNVSSATAPVGSSTYSVPDLTDLVSAINSTSTTSTSSDYKVPDLSDLVKEVSATSTTTSTSSSTPE